jgi:class 3 adenylate cyclase/tetratricopeptide (TPR) repeat protein
MSWWDTLRLQLFVTVPAFFMGLVSANRFVVGLLARHDTGRRTARFLDGLRQKYQCDRLWSWFPFTRTLLLLDQKGIDAVLASKENAADPLIKKSALSKFIPDALTISSGNEWLHRRPFNEDVLGFGEPHGYRDAFMEIAFREVDQLTSERGELAWSDFQTLGQGLSHQVLLGSARIEPEMSAQLARMACRSNLPILPRQRRSFAAFYEQVERELTRHRSGDKSASTTCLMHDSAKLLEKGSADSSTRVPAQIGFWLFVLKDVVELHVARTLALIAAHAQVQDRVREEIRQAGTLTADAVDGLHYLEGCLGEQLRLWTPVPIRLSRDRGFSYWRIRPDGSANLDAHRFLPPRSPCLRCDRRRVFARAAQRGISARLLLQWWPPVLRRPVLGKIRPQGNPGEIAWQIPLRADRPQRRTRTHSVLVRPLQDQAAAGQRRDVARRTATAMTSARPLERRQLTVMLCDLVGSAALSLRLDAEELAEFIQAYRRRCASLITTQGGMVAQYVGDGVLAYFGYPRAHEDDAERAIRAALSIAAAEASSTDVAGSSVHIGIATGIVVVGNLSGDDKQIAKGDVYSQGQAEVSAVGSALNLAARLQTLAEPGMVIVSEETRRLSRGIFEYVNLGQHELKGFDKPVQAWQVIRERGVRSRFHALRSSTLTPLVDRQAEQQELRQLWDRAREGEGRAVLLSAEPGVGKSRLAEVVAKTVVDRSCLRLWYYCSPNLQSSPLTPLVRQLTRAAGFSSEDDDDAKLRKLTGLIPTELRDAPELVPLLANLVSIPCGSRYPPLNMSPQRQKQRLFEVLIQLLECFASRGPVLLVVEDLHWVDPTSDELIGVVIDRLKALPILAILTARPEFQSHWDDRAHLLHMQLSPLERGDSIAMIELLCGDRKIPEPTIRQIAEKTDGLPLFIEDLTRDMLETADQHPSDSGRLVQAGRSPIAIPSTLTDSLMSRLDRLGSAKNIAQTGAVIGREFSFQLLVKVANLPEENLKEELYRLVASGLLISRRSTAVLVYAFKHALVRDVAYSSLLKKAQESLHARIANVLVEHFPETVESQPEVVAYHFQVAKQVGQAVHYLVKAAKLSAKRSGFVEAIDQLDGALRLLGIQPKSKERMRQELPVYLAIGGLNAAYRGFATAECGSAYATALELARELGDAPEIFSALSGVGSFEIARGGFRKCRGRCRGVPRPSGATDLHAAVRQRAISRSAAPLCLSGELTDARKHLDAALDLYERDHMSQRHKQAPYIHDQKSTGLSYLALTLTLLGHLNSGMRAAENGLKHSQSLGNLHTINFSLCYLAAVHHICRNSREALRHASQSLELAREQGFATWIGISQMIRGVSLIDHGQHQQGLEEIRSGMQAHRSMDAAAYEPFGISLFAQGLIAEGRFDEALDALGEALSICERTGERFYLAELWRLKGEVFARKSNSSDAEHWFREAIELSRRQQAKLLELRSAASLYRLVDKARKDMVLREMLQPACNWFDEGLDTPDVMDAKALLTGRI